MEQTDAEGDIPVFGDSWKDIDAHIESNFLGLKFKSGDRLLPRLNIDGNPIANKYCEGKTKRTLKKELKDLKPLRRKV